jgi:hypothetical protein
MGQRAISGYTSIKVFSVTKMAERQYLGETVSDWIATVKPQIVDTIVTQSSDSEFHCLAITIFYNGVRS